MLKYVLQGGTHYMPIKARELEKRILADGWVLKMQRGSQTIHTPFKTWESNHSISWWRYSQRY